MSSEPQACQHCLDPIVAARVYDDGVLTLGRALGRPQPYRVIWVRENDRRPYCWVPCGAEPDGQHWLPHKPMPRV